jgi:hypothetical protein
MFNKKHLILFTVIIVLLACKQEKVPEGIVDKDQMINLMVDMHITDSYLNQVYNRDTMLMQAKTRYQYIFKKFGIDSTKFSRSLNYYSKRPQEFTEMYETVVKELEKLEEAAKEKPKKVK